MWSLFALATAYATAITIGPGDVLRLEVYGEPSMGSQFTVTEEGTGHVYCGAVPLTGLTVSEATQRIEQCFRDGWLVEPHVSLSVVEWRSSRIEITGAVTKPGPYFLSAPTPLRMAPSLAGGIALDRSANLVVLTRASGERLEVLFDDLDDAAGDVELAPGDIVKIEQGQMVFVGGEVMKEGSVGYKNGLTAYGAVMSAGGPSPLADLRRAWILRVRIDGSTDKIQVNLRRVRKGKDPDVVLRAGDTVTIPESPL